MNAFKVAFLTLAAGSLLASSALAQVTQNPISVTGYDQNMIVGVGQTFANSGITATMDAGTALTGNTWYALGQNSGALSTGLPVGTVTTSSSDPTTQFLIQPAGGDNAVLINSATTTGTLSLSTAGSYDVLDLFASSGSGADVINYTLNFVGGSTQSGSVTVPDWFTGGSNVAVSASGRINSGGYDSVGTANPNLYELPVAFTYTPGLVLSSVSLSLSSGAGNAAIFGISGQTGVPSVTWSGSAGLNGNTGTGGATGFWDTAAVNWSI